MLQIWQYESCRIAFGWIDKYLAVELLEEIKYTKNSKELIVYYFSGLQGIDKQIIPDKM